MKHLIILAMLAISIQVGAQDAALILKEADNLEKIQKEDLALTKYSEVLTLDAGNLQALVRSSELSANIGGRQSDKKVKKEYYDRALAFAQRALAVDSMNADANYVRAVAASRQTEVEPDNKKLVADVRDIKVYADKALALNPKHGKANYVLGKWNFEVANLSWAKKAAVKVLFGGMGDASMDSAYKYMERCRVLEPYYVQNFLDLAKAYKSDYKPDKAIAVLNQLAKLPVRTANDVAFKAEGKQMLSEMQ